MTTDVVRIKLINNDVITGMLVASDVDYVELLFPVQIIEIDGNPRFDDYLPFAREKRLVVARKNLLHDPVSCSTYFEDFYLKFVDYLLLLDGDAYDLKKNIKLIESLIHNRKTLNEIKANDDESGWEKTKQLIEFSSDVIN